ncbi:MAG: HDOD domain-containing protein [Deltaproteobacteria bacterium]|nr:HDOD domain-containing protein [Deltaproteobacteria bacterium]
MNDKVALPSTSDIRKVLTFDRKELPSFPQVAAKLLEMSRDETTLIEDISRVVESDPGCAARVLEVVNSAIYGLQRKITALPEAVVLLGFDEIRKLSIGMTVFQGLFASGRSREFDRIHFWRHSLSVAVLAMEIAKKIEYSRPEEAYIVGLLHDVGKIFLDLQGQRNYGEFLHGIAGSQDNIVEQERKILGLGHDDVGAFFCSLWKLPEPIVLAVKYHHQRFQPEDLSKEEAVLISIASLSNFVCWTQGIGSFDMVCPPILAPEVEDFIDFEQIDIINCISAMNREVERISEFYQFVFPTPNQIHENLLWTNFKLSRANTRYFYNAPPVGMDGILQTTENVTPSDLGLELGKPLAKAKTIKEVLDIVMFQIGCIFEPVHWSLLLKDPKSGDMIFTVAAGANKEKLEGVRLPRGEGIVGYIMETGSPLIVEDVSRDIRLSNRMAPYDGLEIRSYMATQLKSENKIFGVIELIDKIDGKAFTPEELNMLASISEYAAIAIERAYFNQALQKMATLDALTGLKNRYSLERALGNREKMLKQYGPDASIMIIDIDKFKRINEIKGRQAADGVLKHLADILRKTFRRTDDIFRYEGDKFIVLLSGTDREAAAQAKWRILKTFDTLKGDIEVSISIFVHSVKTDHARGLIHFLEEKLARDKAVSRDEPVENLEQNLQPLLEQEMKKQAPERAKPYHKKVSLDGEFVLLSSKSHGRMRVEGISLLEIGFTITSGHQIRIGEFIDLSFRLDDPKRSLVKRRVVVRKVENKQIDAEVYNPPPYAKNLGFYLMS